MSLKGPVCTDSQLPQVMQLSYNSKFKPQRNVFVARLQRHARKLAVLAVVFVVAVVLIFQTSLGSSTGLRTNSKGYTKLHGWHKTDIPTKSSLIFPSVEHAPLLRELTADGLFNSQVDPQGKKRYLLTDAFDDEDAKLNSKLESDDNTSQMLKVKKSFLDHGKQKFTGPKSPEVVVVTGIDFEKYELSHLTKIVQNRVNYAQKKKYGVYVRWVQEFLPLISDTQSDKDWAKVFLLRSAMYAFPNAKYFWYLDQDAMIMRYDIDLIKYLLDPKVLDPIMLRDQPVVPPNGVVHTYKNSRASNVELILTQVGSDLNLNSFVLKNDFMAKTLLEFWSDKLFRTYHNFPRNTESALTHILQWHPVYLARTAIVPPRTIAGLHTAMELPEGDDVHYSAGDFVVSLRDCATRKSCEKEIDQYWNIVEGDGK
ncbi:CYFA0S20e01134g1_1 [Cyberlindnera fabianii]|uniref:Alpha-1,2-galactosyltransferase n=1 Tax=Cyberlindnera fabianii TaxID=36022 RepID=A0A061BFX3_CYBFA|nr:Alpha-1,2-galactosyltransferase [Cyberlindnera fabianii]CDR45872.1 CYFA0S20e01134g1_1 [Cyberlindnera fabianii]